MWLEISEEKEHFAIKQQGFFEKKNLGKTWYVSDLSIKIDKIEDLAKLQYCQVIEIDHLAKRVRFGRDYLGHYPLLYATANHKLFLSDDYHCVASWLKKQRVRLTICEEAIALYFTMGFVPQTVTLFNEIKACENASFYCWEHQKVSHQKMFTPILPDERFSLEELGETLEKEIETILQNNRNAVVWCSGGLDSSVVAYCCNQKRKTPLLTIRYDPQAEAQFGTGELPFTQLMADHCQAPLRLVSLTSQHYYDLYQKLIRQHASPIIDLCTLAKYSLANGTEQFALTGEGGDILFGGAKNDFMLFMQQKCPHLSLGWLYAIAHHRLFLRLNELMVNGEALQFFVATYFDKLINTYPGPLVTQLMYINTFLKQGSMIFLESYYAAKSIPALYVCHPLTSLSVYEAAFRLPEQKKYQYPTGKIALIDLYQDKLPLRVIQRKKSGTRIPFEFYYHYLHKDSVDFAALRETHFFHDKVLDKVGSTCVGNKHNLQFYHALITLNHWMTYHANTTC